MSKLSKKEFYRQKSIIDANIKHYKICIDKYKTDPDFKKTWRNCITDFKQMLLFWKSMKNNLKLCKKAYTD